MKITFGSLVPLLTLLILVSIGNVDTSAEGTIKQSKSKTQRSDGDKSCTNDRLHREATLTIIDYDNAICDDDHPQFCPDNGGPSFERESKERSNVNELFREWPFQVVNGYKRKSNNGGKNIKRMVQTSNQPISNGFDCKETGFFPGMNCNSTRLNSRLSYKKIAQQLPLSL